VRRLDRSIFPRARTKHMRASAEDRHSLFLLLSVVVFLVLVPFLEHSRIGELILLVMFFVTLFAAAVELSNQKILLWAAWALVSCTLVVHLASHVYPAVWVLHVTGQALSVASFGLVSVGLFAHLGRPGAITKGRLYASVSLYLMLGMFWFSVYYLLETLHPGSFIQTVPIEVRALPRDTLLYFSLVTLTTVGYGDVLPVSPPARLFAALEGATGVLYIAITVARLVAAYQRSSDKEVL